MRDLQSLTKRLGDDLSAALLRVSAAYVQTDRARSGYQWALGALLDEAEEEWSGDREEFWETAAELLRLSTDSWTAFAVPTLRYFVRTVRRCARVPSLDKYQQVLQFAFFAAAGEMANNDKYICNDVETPLAWAAQRVADGTVPTVEDMRRAFLRDEHQPDPWRTFRDGVRHLGNVIDALPDNTRRVVSVLYRPLLVAVEQLEGGENEFLQNP